MTAGENAQEAAWRDLAALGYPIVGTHVEGVVETPDERSVVLVVGEPASDLVERVQSIMGPLQWRIEQVRPDEGVLFGGG